MATSDKVAELDGLLDFAEELRGAATELLEGPQEGEQDNPADELLRNGRAVAFAIQELAARTELLAGAIAAGLELVADAIDRASELDA